METAVITGLVCSLVFYFFIAKEWKEKFWQVDEENDELTDKLIEIEDQRDALKHENELLRQFKGKLPTDADEL